MPAPLIQPRTLKGFRDYLPVAALARERLLEKTRAVFRGYGFAPIDTPALEYLEILTGKGGEESDKQLYRFVDHGGREVGLRFDLTVPLARFAAQYIGELGTPFKRYHIASVWRGENTQRGRYREFMQCDFDCIGATGPAADAETVLVIGDLLRALGVERFTIHLNNRQVLTGLLERMQLTDRTSSILRSLDKLPKIGRPAVVAEMQTAASLSADQAERVTALSEVEGNAEEVLTGLEQLVGDTETGVAGVERLRQIVAAVSAAGPGADVLRIDPSIARGLDYYTGVVFETFLDDLPGIGSVCSGGRYDDLAGLYTKQQLPGVGASLGLDRLLAALEELGLLSGAATPAEVFVPYFAADRLGDYLRLAVELRAAGLRVEVFPEPKKLGQQLKYADRKGFAAAVIAGEDELAAGKLQLKRLADGAVEEVAGGPIEVASAVAVLTRWLANNEG